MNDCEALSIISQRLQPGERILWHGKPDPWAAAREQLFMLLFMTVWTGGVLFGFWNVVFGAKANPNAPLPALLVLGLMIVFGTRAWVKALTALTDCWRTAYAVTDRRILITAGEDTKSFTAAALGDLSRTGNEQQGSLIFGAGSLGAGYGRRPFGFGYGFGLYGIPDPAGVEALIYRTLIMPHNQGAAK